MSDVLLRFLSHGLVDVGGDDAKLEKLSATASDLAGFLKKTPQKAVAYSLVAFDPSAPIDDPVVSDARGALAERWPTYINTFSGVPIAVIRAMLLQALSTAAKQDERVAVAFVSSARNALQFIEAGGERAIWIDVVKSIEAQVDAKAEAEWATPDDISVEPMAFSAPELDPLTARYSKVNRDALTKSLRAASGPQYQANNSNHNTNGNPYWPHNQPQLWVGEFGERSAVTIAETIETAFSSLSFQQPNFSAPLAALANAVAGHINSTLVAVSAATAGLQRRTNLLWWKEALYSPASRISYRQLSPPAAAALMAHDLSRQVPIFSPASVSAFLFEAVATLPSIDITKEFAVLDLLSEARSNAGLEALRTAASDLVGPPEGRGPVLSLIAYPDVAARLTGEEFRRFTGIPVAATLSLPAWAEWVFRELQAAKATAGNHKTVRRSRKG